MPPGPPLCWERLRQGCTKLENAADAVIFERMAPDGKKINLDHICRLRACLGGTRPGGRPSAAPLGAEGDGRRPPPWACSHARSASTRDIFM